MSDCEACLVRNRAICSALSPDELGALSKLGRKQMVSRGQTLVWEGDEALVVANVIQGVLKLSVSTADGREQIVGVVFPSDFIGRPFGKESPYGVTALTDAEVCIFTRAAFDGFAKDHVLSRSLCYMGADIILSPSAWASASPRPRST